MARIGYLTEEQLAERMAGPIGDELAGTFQPLDATLTDLAGRNIGAAAATDILDRAAGDGRYATLAHTHAIADVTGLQAALDGKAAASHSHIIADVTGLQAALDSKLAAADYTATDVLAKVKTVDGVGSGLDADLLDGESGAHYLARGNHTGTQAAATITGLAAVATSGSASDLGSGTLAVARGGTGATATTGSGNNVLSASPTLTGTLSGASSSWTGTLTVNSATRPQQNFIGNGTWCNINFTPSTWSPNFASIIVGANAGNDGAGDFFTFNVPTGKAFRWTVNSAAVFSADSTTVKFPSIGTTAAAANAYIDNAASNSLLRSTSSLRYKQDITTVSPSEARDILARLRGIRYRSNVPSDDPSVWFFGLIAEEVAEIDPRLVHWSYRDEDYDHRFNDPFARGKLRVGATLKPESVMYDRLAVLLLIAWQDNERRLAAVENTLAAAGGDL